MVSFGFPKFIISLNPSQLWPSIPIAILITLIRKTVDYFLTETSIKITNEKISLSKPFWLSIINGKTQQNPTSTNPSTYTIPSKSNINKISKLIETCSSNKKSFKKLRKLSIELNLNSNQIKELKTYYNLHRDFETQKNKFLESIFKLITITPIAIYGIYICYYRNDFFINHYKQWRHFGDDTNINDYNDNKCIINYENEPLIQSYDSYILWYYIISLGYHLNRAMTQFSNPARKDFIALLIHHWTTLGLMICSFIGGKLRTGCITLAIHEYSDIFLESGKLCTYVSFQLGADIFFVFFLLSWIIFRMYCFCYRLLYSITVCGVYTAFMGNSPLFYPMINIAFLYILQGIHIYWFRMILKVIKNKLSGGQVTDVRSEDDESDDDDGTEIKKNKKHED